MGCKEIILSGLSGVVCWVFICPGLCNYQAAVASHLVLCLLIVRWVWNGLVILPYDLSNSYYRQKNSSAAISNNIGCAI